MITLAKRNMMVFRRDKSAFILSFLSVFIVIGLYVFFLGDSNFGDYKDLPGLEPLKAGWIMAGIIAVTSLTTTLGSYSVMMEDRALKISNDFSVAPIKRYDLVGGYVLSAFLSGTLMSIITFFLGEIFIVSSGGAVLSFSDIFQVLAVIVISVLANSTLLFFCVFFMRSQRALNMFTTIVGTLSGFFAGNYVFIGSLSAPVQAVIKATPIAHTAAILRQILMRDPMAVSFIGEPAHRLTNFAIDVGSVFRFGDGILSMSASMSILIGICILFAGLSMVAITKKAK